MTSLPVTPGGVYEHLAGKPVEPGHGPSGTLGRVQLSTATQERIRLTGI